MWVILTDSNRKHEIIKNNGIEIKILNLKIKEIINSISIIKGIKYEIFEKKSKFL